MTKVKKEIIKLDKNNIDTAINKYSVSESNDLIETSFELDKYQLKLISLLSAFIKMDDEDFKIYKFPASGLLNYLGLGKGKHKVLKEILTDLMKKVFIGKYYSDEHNEIREGMVNWIGTADYPLNGEGIIEISIHPRMKYLLLLNNDSNKGNFTTYMLSNIASFKSAYSNRIYRLLKKDLEKGRKYNKNKVVYKYEELRKIFNLENEYSRYYDFKKRVILYPQQELSDLSDIKFTFEEFRIGKSVESIEFTICDNIKKNEKNIEEINNFVENVDLHKDLYVFGFKVREIASLFTKYGDLKIKYSIDYMFSLKTYNNIKDKKAYFKKIIDEKLYTERIIENKLNEKQITVNKEKEEKDKNKEIAINTVEEYNYSIILDSFTEEELIKIKEDFFNEKVKGKWIERVWNGAVEDRAFISKFRQYILEKNKK